MQFDFSEENKALQQKVSEFIESYIYPRLKEWNDEVAAGNRYPELMVHLKELARSEGLWNLFLSSLPEDQPGRGLSNIDYAPLAEIMGRVGWASEIFNCSAPDTGNMELLHMFATPEQKQQWLGPLFNGEIRSCFAMTEPDVGSSDATNIQTLIQREGDDYVINGRKWFISGAMHPLCRIAIVMGRTDPNAQTHRQQSMVLVPLDTPGVEIVRDLPVMDHYSHEGHCEILFKNVRVPVSNLLGEEGGGFAMAQARLGPGRIHHCMRSIGQAELALDLLCARALERKTFGKYLAEQGKVQEWIAESRMEIEQARLLVLKAAWMIDQVGAKAASLEISMIKAVVPKMLLGIADRAMQTYGAMGISPDTPLPNVWRAARALRYADGPDEVHVRAVAKKELKRAKARNFRAELFIGI